LSQRWRLVLKTIVASPSKVELQVKTMCALHNFLRTTNDAFYIYSIDSVSADSFWRTRSSSVLPTQSRHAAVAANDVRNTCVNYFTSDIGSVPWQIEYIHRRKH